MNPGEETFGPTLPVARVRDIEEAIALGNDSEYGLSASVWSRDKSKANAVAARLDVGAVNINSVMMNVFQFPVPQAGWTASGVGGRTGGAVGVLKYTRPQVVISDVYEPKSEFFWYPHRKRSGQLQGTSLGRSRSVSPWFKRKMHQCVR